ncbi:hypothetical protein ACXET9_07310 [Brachybacterium sp. DNPG3]
MLTVKDFWTRVIIGAVMMLIGFVALTGDAPAARALGGILVFAGIGNIVWVVISAALVIRKAKKIEHQQQRRR